MAVVPIEVRGDEKVRVSLTRLGRRLGAKRIMAQLGAFFMTRIKKRTSEGLDYKGKKFPGYSPVYALFRKKKGLPIDKVDLFLTGSMMSAMTYEAQREEVTLFFQSTQDKKGVSNPLKAFFVNQKRPFFRVSAGDIDDALNLYRKEIRQIIREEF